MRAEQAVEWLQLFAYTGRGMASAAVRVTAVGWGDWSSAGSAGSAGRPSNNHTLLCRM